MDLEDFFLDFLDPRRLGIEAGLRGLRSSSLSYLDFLLLVVFEDDETIRPPFESVLGFLLFFFFNFRDIIDEGLRGATCSS